MPDAAGVDAIAKPVIVAAFASTLCALCAASAACVSVASLPLASWMVALPGSDSLFASTLTPSVSSSPSAIV